MRRRGGTDGSLLASLPWTLAALAFAVAPHVQYLPPWITGTFLACAALRWQMERKRWRLPPAWARIVLSLLCFIGVFAAFDYTVSGVGPGSALLAVMAALKLLETRQRRDQFVLLFISIFLIMASLLREQYVWSLPYLLAGLVLTMTAWLRMASDVSEPPRASFGGAGRLLLYAAPLALAMWFFFPRIATPFWAVPIDTSGATAGLNDHMSPGDISSLSLSDAVAFRVQFEGEVPAPGQLYWRGLVLHRFNGRTWTGSEPGGDPRARDVLEVYGEPVRYEITMEATQQRWVYALDIPYDWSLEDSFMGGQHQVASAQPIDQRVAYSAVSYSQYRIDPALADWTRSRYLRLPEDRNPRTAELARRMHRAAGSDREFIEDVLQKFHTESFHYTLEPPPLGGHPVDEFLFDTRRGFCEHFASAFAVMMRAAGLPARVVLGYQGGEINPMGQYMIVRQSDAHAWTEVWLQGRGWERYDPTAAVAPERIESGMSGARLAGIGARWGLDAPSRLLHRARLTWDLFNAKWNDWVLGYGPDKQSSFMQSLGMERPDWRKMMLTLVALLAILVSVVSLLLLRRYRPARKDPAARLYGRFMRKAGLPPTPGESPGAYAGRLAAAGIATPQAVERITRHYLAARYGPNDPQELDALRTAVDEFPAVWR
jgi:protein-glutamine gamma-glutamyltransferase